MSEVAKQFRLTTLNNEAQQLINEITLLQDQFATDQNPEINSRLEIARLKLRINGYTIELENAVEHNEKQELRKQIQTKEILLHDFLNIQPQSLQQQTIQNHPKIIYSATFKYANRKSNLYHFSTYSEMLEFLHQTWPLLRHKHLLVVKKTNFINEVVDDKSLASLFLDIGQTENVELYVDTKCREFSDYASKTDLVTELLNCRIHENIEFASDNTIQNQFYDMESTLVCQELLRRFKLLNLVQASKYTMREFISPVLIGALSLIDSMNSGSVKLICEKNISGNSGNGPVDYILSYKSMYIVIGEAKKGDLVKGLNQNLIQQWNFMESLADKILPSNLSGIKRKHDFNDQLNKLTHLGTFGITSSGSEWVFSRVIRANEDSEKPIAVLQSSIYDLSVIHTNITPENSAVLKQQVECLLRKIVKIINTQIYLISSKFSYLLSDETQTRLYGVDEESIDANETNEHVE